MQKDKLFRMQVHDMFEIGDEGLALSGLIVTGRVEVGVVTVGDKVAIVSEKGYIRVAEVNSIEMSGKVTDTATLGDDVGLLFTELRQADVSKGDIVQSQ